MFTLSAKLCNFRNQMLSGVWGTACQPGIEPPHKRPERFNFQPQFHDFQFFWGHFCFISGVGLTTQGFRRLRFLSRGVVTNPPIGQALPANLFESFGGALRIVDLARVVAEVELANVAEQVMFADVVKRADKAALED